MIILLIIKQKEDYPDNGDRMEIFWFRTSIRREKGRKEFIFDIYYDNEHLV